MELLKVYADKVIGAIRGLDRIRFRGTFRWIASEEGMRTFMGVAGVLLKEFALWAEGKTRRLRASCEQRAEELGIPVEYLRSRSVDKEERACQIARERGIENGSICMFSVVEPAMSPTVNGNKAKKQLELHYRERQCTWIYHYFDHPQLGFGHVRLQTWLPFTAYVCLNGRHTLEKQLQRENIGYVKQGNCFPWIEDPEKAQRLMDLQLRTNWPQTLNDLVLDTCPSLLELLSPYDFGYYWSAEETEWATDVMFKSKKTLDELFPFLVRYGLLVSDSRSVMRYFGKNDLTIRGNCVPSEIMSDLRRRHEGVRVKHWINHNSVKMYNKSPNLLRFETTINDTRQFKVFRRPDDNPKRRPDWLKMRKGVSDLHRRCQISDQINDRYADAVTAGCVDETLRALVRRACNPIVKAGKRYRALNPWNNDDYRLIAFLAKGEWAVSGFRNKDLRAYLNPNADKLDKTEYRRLVARISRLIRLLRIHGLIRKNGKHFSYKITRKGQQFAAALLSASTVQVKQLMQMAA